MKQVYIGVRCPNCYYEARPIPGVEADFFLVEVSPVGVHPNPQFGDPPGEGSGWNPEKCGNFCDLFLILWKYIHSGEKTAPPVEKP